MHVMAEETPTFRTLIASFADFLTVAIHTILYERGIYPETSFLSARKFNFAVRQNRHPKVCEWVNDAVTAVENELYKGAVEHVVVVIYDKHNKPRERFIFDVSRFPVVPLADMDVPLERVKADGSKDTILPFVDMEEELRATMSRLSNCSADMSPLPEGCTFTVAIELKGEGQAPVEHAQAWVPTEGQADPMTRTKGRERQTTPVRAVAAGDMMFECWIEEIADQNSRDKDAPT